MKNLKVFFVIALATFLLFYILATTIYATFNVSLMPTDGKSVIFGIWIAVAIMASTVYIVENPR